jgi:hypothetical protein
MVLLAGVRERHHLDYAGGQVLETVMRHVLASGAVALRSRRVVQPAGPAPLVALAGRALLLAAVGLPAGPAAVELPPIAAPADEEDLSAGKPVTDDEAQRVHGTGRGRHELDADRVPCDEPLVEPTATGTT